MTQTTYTDAEYNGMRKQSRKELFLIEMDWVMPWKGLIALVMPYYLKSEGDHPTYPLMAMLRIHLMRDWFGYSDSTMEEALYETTILRLFTGLNLMNIPDESALLNFRRLLEQHELIVAIQTMINSCLDNQGLLLCPGSIIDATLLQTSDARNVQVPKMSG